MTIERQRIEIRSGKLLAKREKYLTILPHLPARSCGLIHTIGIEGPLLPAHPCAPFERILSIALAACKAPLFAESQIFNGYFRRSPAQWRSNTCDVKCQRWS